MFDEIIVIGEEFECQRFTVRADLKSPCCAVAGLQIRRNERGRCGEGKYEGISIRGGGSMEKEAVLKHSGAASFYINPICCIRMVAFMVRLTPGWSL